MICIGGCCDLVVRLDAVRKVDPSLAEKFKRISTESSNMFYEGYFPGEPSLEPDDYIAYISGSMDGSDINREVAEFERTTGLPAARYENGRAVEFLNVCVFNMMTPAIPCKWIRRNERGLWEWNPPE